MARLLFGLLLFVTVFAQSTFIPRLNPLIITPDLVLVLLFMWAAYHSLRESLLWVFLTGIMLDIIGIDPLGANGLALLIVVALAYPSRNRMFQSNMVIPILLVMVATVVHGIVLYTIRGIPPSAFIGFQALLHALLVPVVYGLVRILNR
ncbi:MAG TPA: rod shape-determining protein MreD [Thermomicrobiales bacterium]|nr:rod shape-determining protein MreD [Thermomicrobiales bacterium]